MTRYVMKLKKKEEVARETMAFWFDTSGNNFSFKPGQFVDITIENPKYTDDEGNRRTFSIASSPNDKDEILITTRMRNTAFKNSLKEMAIGSSVTVEGPMGNFTLHKDASKPAVLLAGGIGITPMISMVAHATENRLGNRIILVYSNKTADDAAFIGKLKELEAQNKNFKLVQVYTREEVAGAKNGHITPEMLKEHVGNDVEKAIFYIAGPPSMVESMRKMLEDMGISDENVRIEEFAGY